MYIRDLDRNACLIYTDTRVNVDTSGALCVRIDRDPLVFDGFRFIFYCVTVKTIYSFNLLFESFFLLFYQVCLSVSTLIFQSPLGKLR